MQRLLLAAALVAAVATPAAAFQDDPSVDPGIPTPAGAYQPTTTGGPFPALMNALFGKPGHQQPDARQPVRRLPMAAPRVAQPSAAVAGTPAHAPRRTRRTPAGEPRNVAALPPPAPASQAAAQHQFDPKYERQVVAYTGSERPGTIVINTGERFLYLVQDDGTAIRYGVGVGREGFTWRGTHPITMKREWPDWRPPAAMRKRQPYLPAYMPGGPNNPLGARALYLGSTLYRIHGSNQPWTIGRAVSSGCIRMRNEDVMDLYERVDVGTVVKVI